MRRVQKCYDLASLMSSQLHAAVQESDMPAVQKLLQSGESVNERDECGSTPLHLASWRGEDMIVQVLLRHGADANSQRTDGATPLDLAELRARGAEGSPPEGLSIKTGAGKFCSVAAMLREATLGHDLALQCHLESSQTGNTLFVCRSIGGVVVAALPVDPAGQTLCSIQEVLARQLKMSQARVRLVLPGATGLPTEAENRMSLAELFNISYVQDAGNEALDKTNSHLDGLRKAQGRSDGLRKAQERSIDEQQCLHLNGLSCSSAASASTCATESDMTHDQNHNNMRATESDMTRDQHQELMNTFQVLLGAATAPSF